MPSVPILRFLILLLTIAVTSVAGMAWRSTRPPTLRQQVESARETLRELRAAVESCQTGLRQAEVGFRTYDEEVATLRARIDALESLDSRGIPADSYPTYLGLVDEFNLAVPDWEAQADSLQGTWEECRTAAETHNTVADSLLRLLTEQGATIPGWVPQPQRFIQPEWDPAGG